jgi:hypothetical protein
METTQPDELDFLTVATNSACDLCVMLIKWRDGVAYRAQICSDMIKQNDWSLSPERQIIIMG